MKQIINTLATPYINWKLSHAITTSMAFVNLKTYKNTKTEKIKRSHVQQTQSSADVHLQTHVNTSTHIHTYLHHTNTHFLENLFQLFPV